MMKRTMTALATIAMLGGFTASANAGLVTIDGVSFEPGEISSNGVINQIEGSTSADLQSVVNAGIAGALDGAGAVESIRNLGDLFPDWTQTQNNAFLAFSFGDFGFSNIVDEDNNAGIGSVDVGEDFTFDLTAGAGDELVFTSSDFDGGALNNPQIWLTYDFVSGSGSGVADFNSSSGVFTYSLELNDLLFNVTGGLAFTNFDTDSKAGGSDLVTDVTINFECAPNSGTLSDCVLLDFALQTGSTNTRTAAIPTPATLGFLGMGLLGIGIATRRRRG